MAADCLGIHVGADRLTAVLIDKDLGSGRIDSSFSLQLDCQEGQDTGALIRTLGLQVPRQRKRMAVALAVQGRLYQTQFHHSEFTDRRQIAQTLRFDIEEDFADDSESAALCYQHTAAARAGTDLIVYRADRKQLVELFEQLERVQLDALVAAPDVAAWLGYLRHSRSLPARRPAVALANCAGMIHVLLLDSNHQPLLTRGFVNASPGQAEALIKRELARCFAAIPAEQRPGTLVYHPAGFEEGLVRRIAEDSSLELCELDEPDPAKAFAMGSAIGYLNGQTDADFRLDALPPQSLVTAKRRALYSLSAAASLLLLILVIVFNAHAGRSERIAEKAEAMVVKNWRDTHNQSEKLPRTVQQMNREIKNLWKQLDGQGQFRSTDNLPDSVEPILTAVFEAIDRLGKDFDLRLKSLRASAETATIAGAMRSMRDYNTFQDAVRQDVRLFTETWYVKQGGFGNEEGPAGLWTFSMSLSFKPVQIASDEQGQRP